MKLKIQTKALKWFLFKKLIILKIELAKKYPKLVEVVSQTFNYLMFY
jgi:hypothetical protein